MYLDLNVVECEPLIDWMLMHECLLITGCFIPSNQSRGAISFRISGFFYVNYVDFEWAMVI